MAVGVQYQRFSRVQIGRVFFIIGTTVVVLVMFQSFGISNNNRTSAPTSPSKSSIVPTIESAIPLKTSKLSYINVNHRVINNTIASIPDDVNESDVGGIEKDEDDDGQLQSEITFQSSSDEGKSLNKENVIKRVIEPNQGVDIVENYTPEITKNASGEVHKQSSIESFRSASLEMPLSGRVSLNPDSRVTLSTISGKQSISINKSLTMGNSFTKRRGAKPMSIADMNLLFLQNSKSNKFKKPQLSSPRDRELQSARFQIEHASIIKKSPQFDASLFRNYSMFKRSEVL